MRTAILAWVLVAGVVAAAENDGWVSLFDGKTLEGWKANQNPDSFRVEDGCIVTNGKPMGHLFYVGKGDEKFKDFEFKAEVKTEPNSNSGVIFGCKWQDKDWIKTGFEAQVCNTYKDPKKTGSLYAVMDVKEGVPDNEWFTLYIKVQGKNIVIKVNDKETVNYTEAPDKQPGKDFARVIAEGTFALQAHDAGSIVRFRNLQVKRL